MRRALIAVVACLPTLAAAQLVGSHVEIDVSAGNQTDPHVSCNRSAYTSQSGSNTGIRAYDFVTGQIQAIPGTGQDLLSDVSGDTVVFTRFIPGGAAIYSYDVPSGNLDELDPTSGSQRRGAAIGASVIAWEDFGLTPGPALSSELVVYEAGATTRLTDDALFDLAPQVSPDGQVVVFLKCSSVAQSGCDTYQAVQGGGGWTVSAVTTDGATHEDASPDTNGHLVVWASNRDGERDLFFRPGAGGPEARLDIPGIQRNPSVAGNLIAFESEETASGTFDVWVYDLDTAARYQVTQTPTLSEQLNDISICGGVGRVVWSAGLSGDLNVHGFQFALPGEVCETVPETVCENPGARPLLAELSVSRGTAAPQEAWASYSSASAQGVLCVDNQRATSGWVFLDGLVEIGPGSFKHSAEAMARPVALFGEGTLRARVAGTSGSGFSARLYGADPACGSAPLSALTALEGDFGRGSRTLTGQHLTQLSNGIQVLDPMQGQPMHLSAVVACSSTTGGSALWLAGLAALLLWAPRRRLEKVLARRHR